MSGELFGALLSLRTSAFATSGGALRARETELSGSDAAQSLLSEAASASPASLGPSEEGGGLRSLPEATLASTGAGDFGRSLTGVDW